MLLIDMRITHEIPLSWKRMKRSKRISGEGSLVLNVVPVTVLERKHYIFIYLSILLSFITYFDLRDLLLF